MTPSKANCALDLVSSVSGTASVLTIRLAEVEVKMSDKVIDSSYFLPVISAVGTTTKSTLISVNLLFLLSALLIEVSVPLTPDVRAYAAEKLTQPQSSVISEPAKTTEAVNYPISKVSVSTS